MPADNNSTVAKPGSRLRELGVVLPTPPSPLGAYVEVSQVGSLLFGQLFGAQAGHVRLVYGVYSAPIGAPVMVQTVFEIES
jgi:hypothetical protein